MQTTRPITKPSKQRKMLFQAPAHIRHRLFAAHLSPELRASHLVKSLPVRSGDTVRILRGDHKGFEGKISRVDLKKYRVYVEGLTREKVDGSTVFVPIHPSKVMITRLNLDDKWRKKILERKKETHKKREKAPEKPKEKVERRPAEPAEIKEVEAKTALEEKPPTKKKATRAKRRTAKKTVTEKAETEAKTEKEPKTAKKRTRQKIVKKTERGE